MTTQALAEDAKVHRSLSHDSAREHDAHIPGEMGILKLLDRLVITSLRREGGAQIEMGHVIIFGHGDGPATTWHAGACSTNAGDRTGVVGRAAQRP